MSGILMSDKYLSFDELSRNETSGMAFSIAVRQARKSFAIVAPHGGGIEPGTSEIADAIAAKELSYYAFLGLKAKSGNTDLHITSTRFDEPMCLTLIGRSNRCAQLPGLLALRFSAEAFRPKSDFAIIVRRSRATRGDRRCAQFAR